MAAEEVVMVVLNRGEASTGLGFSLLGKPGLPPIIYNIVDDSPAAESGEVEVGDVILKVNETEVNRFSTKEVLKCLRLSSDPVTLKLKRDPKIKATLRKHLLSSTDANNRLTNESAGNNENGLTTAKYITNTNHNRSHRPLVHQQLSHTRTNGSYPPSPSEKDSVLLEREIQKENLQTKQQTNNCEPSDASTVKAKNSKNDDSFCTNTTTGTDTENAFNKVPKFEAYMMTGEKILNISKIPQPIIPKQQKKVDNSRYYNSHAHHLRHQTIKTTATSSTTSSSVPNSPNESGLSRAVQQTSVSANASPLPNPRWDSGDATSNSTVNNVAPSNHSSGGSSKTGKMGGRVSNGGGSGGYFVRTSRSEDQLQGDADLEDDLTSSLNTLLLDTKVGDSGDHDRIVWTYNAPPGTVPIPASGFHFSTVPEGHHTQYNHPRLACTLSNGSSTSSNSTTASSSPLRSDSPVSPTSVSSSIMSNHSGHSKRAAHALHSTNGGGVETPSTVHTMNTGNGNNVDLSVSEAISNISSPDYHDEDVSSMMGYGGNCMEVSDHSDSDSTLLCSEPRDHRIVIQVKGPDLGGGGTNKTGGKRDCDFSSSGSFNSCEDEALLSGEQQQCCHPKRQQEKMGEKRKTPSPQSSEDESDVESLHSFHYSPKAVDMPSAVRLAKRLYCLDGFKKSDVSRHLSKNNDFSRAVADVYLKFFSFDDDTLDIALRKFLKQFSLAGETQERERVLVHFSKRYLDCNPGSFNSQDAVHTLTCAIMLLNTDLHGQNLSRKMTCNEFIDNLAGLNEYDNFPREVLKHLYHAIKNYPLEWALDDEVDENGANNSNAANVMMLMKNPGTFGGLQEHIVGGNPFLDVPISSNAVEYKKGYVMRKCCYEANAKRTPFHKRSWKMFHCTLRDLVLYLHKDENGFRRNQMGGDNLHNAIRIHHALATKASDYTKKQNVFRLQTADQAEYLFQTSDSKELQSWIDTINFVCASFSAPPLEAAVGSQKKFQRPLLPCTHTKLNLREQLSDHEERLSRLETEMEEHKGLVPEKGSKSQVLQNYKERDAYLNYEVKRYRTYSYILRSRISQYPDLGVERSIPGGLMGVQNSIGEVDEASGAITPSSQHIGLDLPSGRIVPPPIPERSICSGTVSTTNSTVSTLAPTNFSESTTRASSATTAATTINRR